MSEGFTTEGFKPFPNTYADRQAVSGVAEWDDSRIEQKVTEYWSFLDRKDLMPRAIKAAHQILDLLGFEMDERYKEGRYLTQQENEVCDA